MNVKQGDLALIIHAGRGQNAGKIVKVGAFMPRGSTPIVDGHPWIVSETGWVVTAEGSELLGNGRKYRVAVIADRILRPVSGLPVEEYDRIMDEVPA